MAKRKPKTTKAERNAKRAGVGLPPANPPIGLRGEIRGMRESEPDKEGIVKVQIRLRGEPFRCQAGAASKPCQSNVFFRYPEVQGRKVFRCSKCGTRYVSDPEAVGADA